MYLHTAVHRHHDEPVQSELYLGSGVSLKSRLTMALRCDYQAKKAFPAQCSLALTVVLVTNIRYGSKIEKVEQKPPHSLK